jgi:hypothetical protein
MEALVTYVTVNRRGQAQRDQRRVPGPVLNIGRSSKNEMQLRDARVALRHARITLTDGAATIEAVDGPLKIDGRNVKQAVLAPGNTIGVGPYQIQVETPPEGIPLALAFNAPPPRRSATAGLRRVIRRAPRLSKRRLSYIAFFATLLIFLVVPLTGDWLSGVAKHYGAHPLLVEVTPAVANRIMQTWDPGPLSRSHQIFGSDCRACHQFAFLQVRDSACVACHTTIREHVPRADLTGPRGVEFAGMRCAECHRDHKGVAMAPRAQEECAACHIDVKSAAPHALSGNVTDFSVDHPEFRLSLVDAAKPDAIRRIRLSTPPAPEMVERSNLKFNHALHMDARGVRSPEGDVKLKCSTCHVPDEGGRVMRPISMRRDCQTSGCHSLAFEPRTPKRGEALRHVPHGSVKEVLTTLREYYARIVLADAPVRTTPPADITRERPGAAPPSGEVREKTLGRADAYAQQALRELMDPNRPRKVCVECHHVQPDPVTGWTVAPVRLTRVWMPQALFSHAKHATEDCTLCHTTTTRSKDARDIAMPGVKICQDCHVGARPVLGKVTSDCATCHKFHAGRHFWHDALQTQAQPERKK